MPSVCFRSSPTAYIVRSVRTSRRDKQKVPESNYFMQVARADEIEIDSATFYFMADTKISAEIK